MKFFARGILILATVQTLAISSSAQEPINQYGHQSAWVVPVKIDSQTAPSILWKREVGDGRSQVVFSEDTLFVSSAINRVLEDESVELTERIEAINLQTGQSVWKNEVSSKMLEGQENFSGTPAAPQATPLVVGGNVIWIGFTGIMQCLELKTGKLIWRKDLVTAFGAKPVQFGFAASPVLDPSLTDRFFVMAAGADGGLLCLKVQTGEVIWRSACESFSYATPTFAKFGNTPQLVVVSEDNLIGIAQEDGKQLWSYAFAKPGLTNVPSPLILDTERLLISGQGCNGVRCLKITQQQPEWNINELWYLPKVKPFYQNWLRLDENLAVGCTDKFLAIFDVRDGSLRGRWRGFSDANLASADGGLIALTGDGTLKLIRPTKKDGRIVGMENWAKFQLLKARCWTPLMSAEDMLIVRGGTQLMALSLVSAGNGDSGQLKNQLSAPSFFPLSEN